MKNIFTIVAVFWALNSIAQTTIRVRSTDNLQTIINNATAGSTLIVEAGNYGNITVNKRLNFVGTGYYLVTGSQATMAISILGEVTFDVGSDNSTLTGFQTNNIFIYSSYVIITKNKVNALIRLQKSPNTTSNYVFGIQNVIKHNIFSTLEINSQTNLLVKGNTCSSISVFSSGGVSSTGLIINNNFNSFSFLGEIPQSTLITLKNNICSSLNTYMNLVAEYNVFYNTMAFSLPASNKTGIALSSLFVPISSCPSPSHPACSSQLSATSPARSAGEGGTDCGAFGGDEPVDLGGGIPSGPVVYELSVPSQVTPPSTLNIRVRARVQN